MAENEDKKGWRAELPDTDDDGEEERLRRKWERGQELKNAQREKRLKEQRAKLRALTILACAAVAVIVLVAVLIIHVFIPLGKYHNAAKLVEKGDYAAAIIAYRNMLGYKDADVRLEEAIRLQAVKLAGKEDVYYATSETAPWFSIGEQGNLKLDEEAYRGDWDNVVVPDVFDGILVTILDEKAFAHCEKMTSVTISECVLTIKNYAFLGCDGLKTVTLPTHLETIGTSAFEDCGALETVEFGEELKTIGASAFADCGKLRSVTLPETLTEIGSRAFNDCGALKTVTLSASVQSIGSYAFTACESLETLYFGGIAAALPDLNRTGLENVNVIYIES
ncbi:MAG: leucine-rich repeat domain-containing protein [Clostridia bacterium]|nr:leucine-rich repeat domain-containing protein [Clostridia bacterium]